MSSSNLPGPPIRLQKVPSHPLLDSPLHLPFDPLVPFCLIVAVLTGSALACARSSWIFEFNIYLIIERCASIKIKIGFPPYKWRRLFLLVRGQANSGAGKSFSGESPLAERAVEAD
jgi:hypothetical protein